MVESVFLLVAQRVADPFSDLGHPRTGRLCSVERAGGTSWLGHDDAPKPCQSPQQQLGLGSDRGEHRVRHTVSRKSAFERIQQRFQLRGNISFRREDDDRVVLSQPIG